MNRMGLWIHTGMTDTLLTLREAAAYLRLPLHYLRHQIKHGAGPKFVRPSQRTKFFAIEDLNHWRSTWTASNGNGHALRTESQ